MSSWKRVGREMVRIFFAHDQHIAVIVGKKPRRCSEIELVDETRNPRVPIISVQCGCEEISQHADPRCLDHYCVVKPVIAGPLRPYVTVLHRDGTDLVKVEPIRSLLSPKQTFREVPTSAIPASEGASPLSSAIGFSQNYSLDEAFQDALQKLRLLPAMHNANDPSLVDVVSMGAVYGGFAGFSRMFVKVEQSIILNLPPNSAQKKVPGREVMGEAVRLRKRSSRE